MSSLSLRVHFDAPAPEALGVDGGTDQGSFALASADGNAQLANSYGLEGLDLTVTRDAELPCPGAE